MRRQPWIVEVIRVQQHWRGRTRLIGFFGVLLLALMGTFSPTAADAGASSALVTWGRPQLVDQYRQGSSALSIGCVTASLCFAGNQHGQIWRYDGRAWSLQAQLAARSSRVGSMSCVSPSFCMANVDNTASYVYDGNGWRRLATPAGGLFRCLSATLCIAVSDTTSGTQLVHTWQRFDGHDWSSPVTFGSPSPYDVFDLSCASATFCLAVDGNSDFYRFDGSTWSGPTAAGRQFQHLACTTPTFCVAVSSAGAYETTTDGTTWSVVHTIGSPISEVTTAVCPNSSLCVVGDTFGHAAEYTLSTGHWRIVTITGSSVIALGCVSSGFCVASGPEGEISYRHGGGTWSPGAPMDQALGGTGQVSCAGDNFCALGDSRGGFSTFDGSTWAPPADTTLSYPAPYGFTALSCSSSTFCATPSAVRNGSSWTLTPTSAAGYPISCTGPDFCATVSGVPDSGVAWTFDGTNWHSSYLGFTSLTAVGCFARQCVAQGDKTYLYSGGRWSAAPHNAAQGAIAINCPTANQCLALTELGSLTTYVNGQWHPGPNAFTLSFQPGVNAYMTCPTTTLCVAAYGSTVRTFNGSTWSPGTQIVSASTPITSLSCSLTTCAAAAGTSSITVVTAKVNQPLLATTGSPVGVMLVAGFALLAVGIASTLFGRRGTRT